jgi:hypothetical protein
MILPPPPLEQNQHADVDDPSHLGLFSVQFLQWANSLNRYRVTLA